MDLVLIFMDVEGLMYYIVGSMSSREQMDYTQPVSLDFSFFKHVAYDLTTPAILKIVS